MSALFPSLTMTIVCSILGFGFAYVFYSLTARETGRFLATAGLLLVLLFVFSNYAINRHLFDPKLMGVFLLAMFIGLLSTPLDD